MLINTSVTNYVLKSVFIVVVIGFVLKATRINCNNNNDDNNEVNKNFILGWLRGRFRSLIYKQGEVFLYQKCTDMQARAHTHTRKQTHGLYSVVKCSDLNEEQFANVSCTASSKHY